MPSQCPRRGLVHTPGRNRLLAVLPAADWARLEPRLERLPMPLGQPLHEPDAPITHVYFPLSGLVSLVVTAADGTTLEACVVGNEGAVGIALLLGADRSTMRAFFQTPGEAYRMDAAAFRTEVRQSGALGLVLKRYTHAMFMQVSQSVLCNRLHSIEERMARWILMTHDRVGSDELQLTQQFIAQMLGVRRPSVTVVAGTLQRAGLIRYARGRVTVVDRSGLEDASCECYGTVRQEFERILSGEKPNP